MADSKTAEEGTDGDPTSTRVVAPTTRVSVAFPFSHLHIEESSKQVTDLATIVARFISLVEESAPNPGLEELRKEVSALLATLQ